MEEIQDFLTFFMKLTLMSINFAHENLPQNTRVLSYKRSGDHVTYPISPQASRSLNCLSANHQFPASPDHVSHKNVYLTLGYSIAPGMSDGQLLVYGT